MRNELRELLVSNDAPVLEFPENTVVLEENQRSDALYYILFGQLEALKKVGGRMLPLYDIFPNTLIGLFSFFEEESRAFSMVRTKTPVALLRVTKELDHSLEEKYPEYRRILLSVALAEFQNRMKHFAELHHEAHRTKEKLILLEKIATVGRLAASLAHELNNNVTLISKGLEYTYNELPRVLGERFTALEKRVYISALKSGYQKKHDQIRAETKALLREGGFAKHGRKKLQQVVEIQNNNPKVAIAEMLELSDHDLRNLHSLFLSACKFRTMMSASSQITHVVQSFKQLSKPPSSLEKHPPRHTIEKATELLEEQLKRVKVRYEDEGVQAIECRPADLIQLWCNLISNAIDAMNGKGELTFRIRQVDDSVEVAVEDTGPGIPAEIAEHIFEPHITTKSQTSTMGLGLGLTICRQIVTHHGGRIWADPNHSGGLVMVRLPIKGEQ